MISVGNHPSVWDHPIKLYDRSCLHYCRRCCRSLCLLISLLRLIDGHDCSFTKESSMAILNGPAAWPPGCRCKACNSVGDRWYGCLEVALTWILVVRWFSVSFPYGMSKPWQLDNSKDAIKTWHTDWKATPSHIAVVFDLHEWWDGKPLAIIVSFPVPSMQKS